MRKDKIIKTVLDIGSNKIKVLTGELSLENGKIKVLEYLEQENHGVFKGEIVDAEAVAENISDIIGKLKTELGFDIEKVTVGVSGEKIKSTTVNVTYSLDEERKMTEEDIEELKNKGIEIKLLNGEKAIRVEVYNLKIDNSGVIENPVGMEGRQLQGDVHLIYTDKENFSKLVETINRAGIDVEDVIFGGYATAKSTLEEEERKMGVAVADIGEGTTDIVLYKYNKLIYAESIPLGGMYFRRDLKIIYELSDTEVDEILKKYREKEITEEGTILYGEDKRITLQEISEAIEARLEDIIDKIKNTIFESGFKGYLGTGLILTGGVMEDNIVDTEKFLNRITEKTGHIAKKRIPVIAGIEETKARMAAIIGMFYEVIEKEEKINGQNYAKERIRLDINEKNDNFDEIDIFNEEKKEDKESSFNKIKKWISNFI